MEFMIKPWQHQLDAIDRAKNTPHFAFFMEMGTGKTATTINVLRYKFNLERRILKTLILCPPIVIENWKREFALHSKVDPGIIFPLTGSGEKRVKIYTKVAESGRPAIFITNYEALQMSKLYDAFQQYGFEVLICDESQRLKNPQAIRTKLAVKLARGFGAPGATPIKYRYILSGTPILNTPMDIFSQYLVMDGGETFGDNFYSFRNRYFYDKNSGMPAHIRFPAWVPRSDTHERLNALVYRKAHRVLKADCLDLPPLVRQRIQVELGPQQRRVYEEMKRDFITYLHDKACVASLAITKALRLQQIVSGYVQTEDGHAVAVVDNPRMAALREVLEEISPEHKVIVWAMFKENYRQIKQVCEELGIKSVTITGDDTAKEKVANVDAFEKDPEVRVCIANQSAGGVGINLVAASYSIFYSRSFSLEADLQAEARNYRGGSERHRSVTRVDLVAAGTIDELVLQALSTKQNIAEEVLKWKNSL